MQERPVNLNEPPAGNPVDRLPATINIESLIYVVRDEQVMLDSDLAKLYDVETKVLNQAVKRNIQCFPPDFMFQLTNKGRGGARYLPYAFTENGVAMHACNKAHDCFLIIDEEVYHIGHSLKDLGKKLFAFSKMDVMTGSELLSRL